MLWLQILPGVVGTEKVVSAFDLGEWEGVRQRGPFRSEGRAWKEAWRSERQWSVGIVIEERVSVWRSEAPGLITLLGGHSLTVWFRAHCWASLSLSCYIYNMGTLLCILKYCEWNEPMNVKDLELHKERVNVQWVVTMFHLFKWAAAAALELQIVQNIMGLSWEGILNINHP